MSTKHAPKKGAGKAGLKHRKTATHPVAASGRIPVLIRMPDIRELDTQEADFNTVATDASNPAPTGDLQTRNPKTTGPIASPDDDLANTTASTRKVDSQPDPSATPLPGKNEKSFSTDMSQFNWRRFAWPVGGAVGLIVLFAIAYGFIAGGGDAKQSPSIAESDSPDGVSRLNEMKLSVDQGSQTAIDIIPKLPPAPSAEDVGTATESESEQDIAVAQSPRSPMAQTSAVVETPTKSASPSDAQLADSNPADSASAETDPAATNQAETMEEVGTIEQTSAIDPPSGNSIYGEDLAANEPLGPVAGAKDSGHKYPTSNPANFQYPAEYHKFYDAKFQAGGNAFANSQNPDGLQQYNNPRLGSRLQPPPVR